MRRLFLLIAILTSMCAAAQTFGPDEYQYNISWKYGLLNIQAAKSTVKVDCKSGHLSAHLTGRSIEWEGRIYEIVDRFDACMSPDGAVISYVNGTYRKPKAGQYENPDLTRNYRNTLGQGTLSASQETMECVAITANMLCIYYYAQTLDFESMKEGEKTVINITNPNGTTDTLTITYLGNDGNYQISAEFGIAKIPVNCEIDPATRVPVSFSSNIKIGHVVMEM